MRAPMAITLCFGAATALTAGVLFSGEPDLRDSLIDYVQAKTEATKASCTPTDPS